MLGWSLVFALMSLLGILWIFLTDPGAGFASVRMATFLFGALFCATILTRLMRRRV